MDQDRPAATAADPFYSRTVCVRRCAGSREILFRSRRLQPRGRRQANRQTRWRACSQPTRSAWPSIQPAAQPAKPIVSRHLKETVAKRKSPTGLTALPRRARGRAVPGRGLIHWRLALLAGLVSKPVEPVVTYLPRWVGGSGEPVGGGAGEESWAGQRPILPSGRRTLYKARGTRGGERSLPRSAPRLPPLLPFLPVRSLFLLFRGQERVRKAHGVQLRGHRCGGRQVPRPLPPPQHHAHRRGRGVAEAHAEELVVRLLRPRPRPRAQVRLRPGHTRRVFQVPPPPQQFPRPRPPGVPSLPGRHHLRRASAGRATVVLPHRRGAVTAPVSLKCEI